MNHLQNALTFISHFEDDIPLSSYGTSFEDWQQAVQDSLLAHGFEMTPLVESILELRKAAHAAAFSQQIPSNSSAKTNWKWLLHHPQIAQRTQEWYLEKQEILTASEIGKLWQGPAARASLIMSKATPVEGMSGPQRLASLRSQTNAFGWGIRYEPVAKLVLEETTGSKIQDLGRIRHRTVSRLAASPDGLFVSGELEGRLVEIKCPISRVIKENEIPKEYWQQIQIQLEVCDLEHCEYVEVKVRQLEASDPDVKGWITLWLHNETLDTEYEYHPGPDHAKRSDESGWQPMETYGWATETVRRVTVVRERQWFQSIQPTLEEFWKTVEAARLGEWQPPPKRARKPRAVEAGQESRCAIVSQEEETAPLVLSPSDAELLEASPSLMPAPTSYIEPETTENGESSP